LVGAVSDERGTPVHESGGRGTSLIKYRTHLATGPPRS